METVSQFSSSHLAHRLLDSEKLVINVGYIVTPIGVRHPIRESSPWVICSVKVIL